jgi:hypothetical protein
VTEETQVASRQVSNVTKYRATETELSSELFGSHQDFGLSRAPELSGLRCPLRGTLGRTEVEHIESASPPKKPTSSGHAGSAASGHEPTPLQSRATLVRLLSGRRGSSGCDRV